MSLDVWLYYVVAIFILGATPGPNSLLCLTKGVTLGARMALWSAFGSLTATLVVLTLSFTGLGVLVASSEWVFNIVKWCGAAYLVYLGVMAFMSKQDSYDYVQTHEAQGQKGRGKYHFSNGFIVGASNPKAIVFFTALFPQFIDPQVSMVTQYFVFVATFIVLEFGWLALYSQLGVRSSRWLIQPGRAKIFNRLSGSVFVGAGVLLSTSARQ